MNEILLNKFSDIFKNNILPLTIKGVETGNKIFGAAIINKDDHSLVVAGSNNETENPLWHGEIHTLKKFYELNNNIRPNEKNCIFLSSHEPCSLCLSAITFSGFDNFYYLIRRIFLKYKFLHAILDFPFHYLIPLLLMNNHLYLL